MRFLPYINPVIIIFACFAYVFINAGLGAWLAEKKGYSAGAWFFLCLLAGPVGLIALAGAPNQQIASSGEQDAGDGGGGSGE